jgi:hypothetical protein
MHIRQAAPTRIQRTRWILGIVHVALWSMLTAVALFLILSIPRMTATQLAAAHQRALNVAEENKRYCEKWGMEPGTHEHTLCTLDLQELRARIEQRIADDMAF